MCRGLLGHLEGGGHKVYLGALQPERRSSKADFGGSAKWLHWNRDSMSALHYQSQILNLSPDVFVLFGASCEAVLVCSLLYRTGIPLVYYEGDVVGGLRDRIWSEERGVSLAEAIWERELVLAAATRIKGTLECHGSKLPPFIQKQIVRFEDPFQFPSPSQQREQGSRPVRRIIGICGDDIDADLMLIESFLRLAPQFKNWELVLFFSPLATESRSERIKLLKEYVEQSGIGNAVRIAEMPNDFSVECARSDINVVGVLASDTSSLVATAMAHGIPTVAYGDCKGIKDLVRSGHNGLLVPPEGNQVAGLMLALSKLMRSFSMRDVLGNQAADDFKERNLESGFLSWEKMMQEAVEYKNTNRLLDEQKAMDFDLATHYARMAPEFYLEVLGDEFSALHSSKGMMGLEDLNVAFQDPELFSAIMAEKEKALTRQVINYEFS